MRICKDTHVHNNTRNHKQTCAGVSDTNIGDTIVAVVDSIQCGWHRQRPPVGEGAVCCGWEHSADRRARIILGCFSAAHTEIHDTQTLPPTDIHGRHV